MSFSKDDLFVIKHCLELGYDMEDSPKKSIKQIIRKVEGEMDKPEELVMVCPFRVFTEVHPAMLRGNGDMTSMQFYPCCKEQCMAYEDGKCRRLFGGDK